tara:strand:+ start:275 stop:1024 length:750 start_codon:yes stop_codon:yes gene_type:complete
MAKDIQEKQAGEVVLAAMFEEARNDENLGADDLALPFLKIYSGQEDFEIDGKKGDLFNSVTNEVYPGAEGVRVIFCAYQKRFIEWAPRGSGSGAPKNIFEPHEERPKTERDEKTNQDMVVGGDGNYIDETHQHFCLVLNDDGTADNVLVIMKGTQLKKSRKLNSMFKSQKMKGKNGVFNPARYCYVCKLKTVREENAKGNWHGFELFIEGPVEDADLFQQAKSFHESITAGDINIKHESDEVREEKHAF